IAGRFRRAGSAYVRGSRFQFLSSAANLRNLSRSNNVPPTTASFRYLGRVHLRRSFPFSTQSGLPNKMSRSRGNFAKGVTGFAGFRFATGSIAVAQPQFHYGWIRLRWDDSVIERYKSFAQFFTVIDWAYNDVVGAPIHVGDTQAVPEPNTLLLTLVGAGA